MYTDAEIAEKLARGAARQMSSDFSKAHAYDITPTVSKALMFERALAHLDGEPAPRRHESLFGRALRGPVTLT